MRGLIYKSKGQNNRDSRTGESQTSERVCSIQRPQGEQEDDGSRAYVVTSSTYDGAERAKPRLRSTQARGSVSECTASRRIRGLARRRATCVLIMMGLCVLDIV